MFDKIKKLFASRKSVSSPNTNYFLTGDFDPISGAVMSNALTQSAIVYACIRKLAESVSGMPLEFFKGKRTPGATPLDSGLVFDLFQKPNRYCDGQTFIDLIVEWLHYYGEAFIVGTDDAGNIIPIGRKGLRGAGAKISELHVLPSYRMREVILSNRSGTMYDLDHWIYSGSSFDSAVKFAQFIPDEVIHIKLANPFWQWRGLSPLRAADLDASMDFAAGVFQKGMMMDNAEQGLIVTMDSDDPISDEQREQIRATLRNRKNASNSGDRYTIIGGKNVKIEKPSLSSADAQLLENRNFGRRGICAALDVPEQMIGFWDASNRSTSVTIRKEFYQNRVYKLHSRILDTAIQPIVNAIDPSIRAYFDIYSDPVYQEVLGEKIKSLKVAVDCGIPLNIATGILNIDVPPIEGGDDPMMHVTEAQPEPGENDPENADEDQDQTSQTPKNEVNGYGHKKNLLKSVNDSVNGKGVIELRRDLLEHLEGNAEMQDRVKRYLK